MFAENWVYDHIFYDNVLWTYRPEWSDDGKTFIGLTISWTLDKDWLDDWDDDDSVFIPYYSRELQMARLME